MIGRKTVLEDLEKHLAQLHIERKIAKVIVHHFWRPRAADWKGLATLQSVYNYHVHDRGWSDIGYHLVIGPDSTLWLARPMEMAGAHTAGQNEHSIGIAYAADFDTEDPAENGYDAGIMACAMILKRFKLDPEDVYFHRDFAQKSCPGTKMDRESYREDLKDALKPDESSFVRLKIDDKVVRGACVVVESGIAVGLEGPIAAAIGLPCSTPDKRVPVRQFLRSVGVTIPPEGWHPEQGPHGTIYAYKIKPE